MFARVADAGLDSVVAQYLAKVRSGDALALGVGEGPELGGLLDAVEEWWADRDFAPNREDCLDRLKELIAAK